ncbi:diguanylate cyclase (GGDEF)-like protein [Arthrobacter sp. PvP102]|uniref:GGDEF domain-containing protein n=1 Tax=unclassified Arthrobacter TaxID=235627 RepID=UPI001AE24BE6|nr:MULTISPECIES: GGDEF domain-containing protein [unclassified Arthrobacter]MBP1234023.1 diguanylate cyclase (GGDEF)-like protein [Arthrobacter sp. PvP103]MBP1239157.1 diguanylate cyclase (GGDEF)-like protein [Arthrobacter sp. PvP102]
MQLDTLTLRVAFAIVAFTLALLFYFAAYRSTRSPYSAWWCVALTLFLAGSAAYLFNGTPQQVWANPLGNCLLVAGGACVWAGARSLRAARPRSWQLAAGPAVVSVSSALENPGVNIWAGGAVFLALMGLMLGLASRELWRLEPGYSRVRIPLAIAAAFFAAYYFCRLVVYLAEGPDGRVFVTYFGSAVTTLVTMVLLVVVSFSMAALSSEQQTRALRAVATQDGLTGLLNRAAFLDLASEELLRLRHTRALGTLVLADLDHFKAVNDTYGHAAGDAALQSFASACNETVRSTDLVGRYGGEEFIFLLPGVSPDRAEAITAEINKQLEAVRGPDGSRMPTVSYGIAPIGKGTSGLDELIATADAALYRAKSLGRNRTVRGIHTP